MALDVSVDTATQIIDMTRERGVHSMATPLDDGDRLELCEKIVNACRAVYRGGEGNAEDTVLNVLKLVGDIPGGEVEEAAANGKPEPAAEEPQAEEPAVDETPDEDEEEEVEEESPAEEESSSADDDEDDEDEDVISARKAAEEAQLAAAEAERKSVEKKAAKKKAAEEEAAAKAEEAQHAAAAAEVEGGAPQEEDKPAPKKRSKKAGAKVLDDQENEPKMGALEALVATGLPMPKSDSLESVPEPLPSDITAITDVELRRLHWQRHALRSHAGWLLAKVELDEYHNGMLYDDLLHRKVAFLRPDAAKDTTAGELRSLAREKDAQIVLYQSRVERAHSEAGLLKALVSDFDNECGIISREMTNRIADKTSTATPTT